MKVIEEIDCSVEVAVIPPHISTAIKMVCEDSLIDTCLDSQLHHLTINVKEAALGNACSI